MNTLYGSGRKKKKCKVEKPTDKMLTKGGFGEIFINSKNNIVKISSTSLKSEFTVIKLLNTKNNPYVPKVYCWEQIALKHYIEMEYIEGTELWTLMDEKEISGLHIKIAYRWILDIANIVLSIHNEEYAHLDLKPNNLIMSKDGMMRIIDFGNSLQFRDRFENINFLPDFLPPELNTKSINSKTPKDKIDIYCLGVIMTLILRLCDPGPIKNELLKLVDQCKHTNPIKRISSKELVDVLEKISM